MKKLLLVLLLSCPIWNVLAISGLLKQSTAVNVTVVMIDSTNHVVGKTGLTLTIRESKAGGAFAAITPTVTELEGGVYSIAFTVAHTDTLGELRLRVTAAGADESDPIWQVVALLPGDNVTVGTNLDKTGYSLTQAFPANFSSLSIDGSGVVKSNQVQVDGVNNAAHAAGMNPSDMRDISGSGVTTSTAQIGVNVVNYSLGQDSVIRRGTAQNGSASSITLDASASSTNNMYQWQLVSLNKPDVNSHGGQTRLITSYDATTKIATVSPDWAVAPTAGDVFIITPWVDIWNVTLPSTYTGQKAGALLWKIGNRPN